MRAKALMAPALVAALVAGCQTGTESQAPTDKPSKAPAKDKGDLLSVFKPSPVIPEGTTLHLVVETALSSATSKPGDPVVGEVGR